MTFNYRALVSSNLPWVTCIHTHTHIDTEKWERKGEWTRSLKPSGYTELTAALLPLSDKLKNVRLARTPFDLESGSAAGDTWLPAATGRVEEDEEAYYQRDASSTRATTLVSSLHSSLLIACMFKEVYANRNAHSSCRLSHRPLKSSNRGYGGPWEQLARYPISSVSKVTIEYACV